MNNNNNQEDSHDREDTRFAELFASLDADIPEVDELLRERLEKESARAFAEQFSSKTIKPRRNKRMYV